MAKMAAIGARNDAQLRNQALRRSPKPARLLYLAAQDKKQHRAEVHYPATPREVMIRARACTRYSRRRIRQPHAARIPKVALDGTIQ